MGRLSVLQLYVKGSRSPKARASLSDLNTTSEMQEGYGSSGAKVSSQPSPTRWVDAAYIDRAAEFVRSLP